MELQRKLIAQWSDTKVLQTVYLRLCGGCESPQHLTEFLDDFGWLFNHSCISAFTGSFVKLLGKGGEVCSTYPVAPLSDLKIRLIGPHGVEIPGDLYAKVVGKATDTGASFAVRFTSVPPEVAMFLRGFLSSSASPNA